MASKPGAFKPAIVVFDACVLYPFHLRNILVQAAVDRLVDARWTEEIHAEWIRNLIVDAPGIPVERLEITRKLMNDALPNATIGGYHALIESIALPDSDDRHVFAAAITVGASVILTWNLRDFPTKELNKYGLTSLTPDSFLADLYDKVPDMTLASLASARGNLSKTRVSVSDFIEILRKQNLTGLATRVAKHPMKL